MSTKQNTLRPQRPSKFATDCGKKGHARRGCECERCVYTRTREHAYGNRWRIENDERYRETRKEYLKRTNNATSKRYEKTPKGYLMRSYRNMESRVRGIQKHGSWFGKELLPREEFYSWALGSPDFGRLFAAYEASGFDRKLAPSPDRIDPAKGYTLDNMRWLTHSENSSRAKSNARLTPEQVLAIRAEYRPGSGRVIAEKYGVTQSAVSGIVNRRTWRDL